MKGKQLKIDADDLICNNCIKESYSSLIEKPDGIYLKALIFRQSSRIVYRCVMSFWDIEKLCKHTPVKPEDDKEILLNIDNIKNRYLEVKHSKEIGDYIKNNIDDFILPNLTSIINVPFHVFLNLDDSRNISTEIFREVHKNKGSLLGYIKFKPNTVFNICDGNHRTYSIHQLVENGYINKDMDGLYIGVDFYLEVDKEKEKKVFVNLNTNKSIDSALLSLIKEEDCLTNACKSLLGVTDNFNYVVYKLHPENENYIGVDILNNISKTNNVLSFNMIKNMVCILAFGTMNCIDKFNYTYDIKKSEYKKFMKKISGFLNYIFDNCKPFNEIKHDSYNLKQLKQQYISLNAAGLYLMASIGHVAIENPQIDIMKMAEVICNIDWRKNIGGELNKIFLSGILGSSGKLLSGINAINNSSNYLKSKLKILNENIKMDI